jgi:5-methylcytosine-specific restriction protein A
VSLIWAASLKAPPGARRSPKWPALRRHFLKGKRCAVCGGTKKLEAHHIVPFHVEPRLELDERNLIPLCEGNGVNCHLLFGHLGDFRCTNKNVCTDATVWAVRISERKP